MSVETVPKTLKEGSGDTDRGISGKKKKKQKKKDKEKEKTKWKKK